MMRSLVTGLLLLLGVVCAPIAGAAEGAQRFQVAAATRDAVSNLVDEISNTYLTRNLTVGEFLRKTDSAAEFRKTLERAEQIGGPRWIDDRTCQIELQISGPIVARALMRIATANARQSPITPGELNLAVKDWPDRSFSSTGTATSSVPVAPAAAPAGAGAPKPLGLMPVRNNQGAWAKIPEEARDSAINAAKHDAARRSLNSVKPVALTQKSTVGDVLDVKDVGDGMETWLVSQRVARLELTDDLQAQVALSASPTDTFSQLQTLASKQDKVPVPGDDNGWAQVKTEFEKKMLPPVGTGVVPGDAAASGFAPKPFGLRGRRPEWAHRRIEAQATSTPARTKLLAARSAEFAAEEKLRVQIEALPYNKNQTLGEAAAADKRIAQAISRSLTHSRIASADYRDDGSANVEVFLDLDDLWQELRDLD
jgi:hypothetical protein